MNMIMHGGAIKQQVAWIGRLKITCTFFRSCSWLEVDGGGMQSLRISKASGIVRL